MRFFLPLTGEDRSLFEAVQLGRSHARRRTVACHMQATGEILIQHRTQASPLGGISIYARRFRLQI